MSRLIEILNNILAVEYTFIVHGPRLASLVRDAEAARRITELTNISVLHADGAAKLVKRLGGEPGWAFAPFPEGLPIGEILKQQREKELLAAMLYDQASALASEEAPRAWLSQQAQVERQHAKIVEQIMARLAASPSP